MKRGSLALLSVALIAMFALVAACGGDDNGDGDGDTGSATARGAQSPGATGTRGSGTPDPNGTPLDEASAVPANTLTPEEATAVAGDLAGGAADATPFVVSTIPPFTPVAGATPAVDSTQIAPPDPGVSDLRIIVDMDASQAGIQTTRDVNPGDTFRVAIVVTNIPARTQQGGGLNALQFDLNYDKTRIVAPSYFGGDAVDRNPDLNQEVLGVASNWTCLPAPEGDRDDPGGSDGDFLPNTGQAYLACFVGIGGAPPEGSGTLVVAVVTFQAISSGSSQLTLSNVVMGDFLAQELGSCEDTGGGAPVIPCPGASVTVR